MASGATEHFIRHFMHLNGSHIVVGLLRPTCTMRLPKPISNALATILDQAKVRLWAASQFPNPDLLFRYTNTARSRARHSVEGLLLPPNMPSGQDLSSPPDRIFFPPDRIAFQRTVVVSRPSRESAASAPRTPEANASSNSGKPLTSAAHGITLPIAAAATVRSEPNSQPGRGRIMA